MLLHVRKKDAWNHGKSSILHPHLHWWHAYTVLYLSPQRDSMRIHEKSFAILNFQEGVLIDELHANIWHPLKLTRPAGSFILQLPGDHPERTEHTDVQPWGGLPWAWSTPPSSDVGCLAPLLPSPIHPHQFTCNRKILVHNDSDDSLLIHGH